jgi:hypothetical protein
MGGQAGGGSETVILPGQRFENGPAHLLLQLLQRVQQQLHLAESKLSVREFDKLPRSTTSTT